MRKRGLILKSTLFYFKGYTRYCGNVIWNETCDFSNIYALLEAVKKL
jgi:hypothetical protein